LDDHVTAHFVQLLEDLRRRSLRMASLVEDMIQEACEAVYESGDSLAQRVISRDNDVDTEEVHVESEVIRLMALYQPVGIDLRLVCTILKVNSDLERIADCAVNIAERGKHVNSEEIGARRKDLEQMEGAVRTMLRHAVQAYGSQDLEMARRIRQQDDAVDALYEQVIREVVAEGSALPEEMATHLDVLSIAKNLERIADHATNIAEDVVFLLTGEIVRHRPRTAVSTDKSQLPPVPRGPVKPQ
jgi:phosphate transport system protein